MFNFKKLSVCVMGSLLLSGAAFAEDSIPSVVQCVKTSGADSVMLVAQIGEADSSLVANVSRVLLRSGRVASSKAYGNGSVVDQFNAAGHFEISARTGDTGMGGLMRIRSTNQPSNEKIALTFSGETQSGKIELTSLKIQGRAESVAGYKCEAFQYQ